MKTPSSCGRYYNGGTVCVREQYPATAERQYVKLLELAATTSEEKVEATLRQLVESGTIVSYDRVASSCRSLAAAANRPLAVAPVIVELATYDALLSLTEEVAEQWSI
jgi:hypothetical protein